MFLISSLISWIKEKLGMRREPLGQSQSIYLINPTGDDGGWYDADDYEYFYGQENQVIGICWWTEEYTQIAFSHIIMIQKRFGGAIKVPAMYMPEPHGYV